MSLSPATEPVPLKTDRDGVARVGGTRVALDAVVAAFLDGATAEEIAHRYPSLELADVYAVIGYYLRHRREVEDYLRERRREGGEVRRKNESGFDPTGIRERLVARRPNAG